MANLTEAQLQLIEENRQRALLLKSKKAASRPASNLAGTKLVNISTKHMNEASSSAASFKTTSAVNRQLGNSDCCKKQSYKSSTNPGSDTGTKLSCSLIQNGRFLVTCKYNPKLVTAFKSISSRRYDPDTIGWSFSVKDYGFLASKLRNIGFALPAMSNAVLVKDRQEGSAAVLLNDSSVMSCSGTCYLMNRNRFEIDMPYNAACVGLFKIMPSRMYNVNTRRWNFDLSDYNELFGQLKTTENVHIQPLPSAVIKVFKDQLAGKKSGQDITECDLSEVDEYVVSSLMPFQKEGVNLAVARNGRVLLADDMGLGKTVQSICIAAYYRTKWPLLVVCPSSVRLMWKEALLKWLPSQVHEDDVNVILTGRDSFNHSTPVTIISYDLLTKNQKMHEAKNYQVVILDESHFIKNFKTARSRAATTVLKRAEHVLLLSGTPALSRPCELYTQIAAVRPELFPVFHHFGLRYCNGKQTPWGWEYSGSSNMDELRYILQETVMVRRTKSDVLTQLPPKLRRSVTIDVNMGGSSSKQRKALEEAHNAVEKKGISAVERHGLLLQYFNETASVKLSAIKSYILDLLEGGHKFLLFAHHRIVLDSLEELLSSKGYDYMRVDGSTSSERRQSEVAKFQEKSNCKVALLSITAANMGITLHSASLVVFAELFWNPGILVQAEDRCYRIGQRDVVNIHYLVAKRTADDIIWEMVKKKLEILSKAGLNGSNFDDTETHVAPQRKQNDMLNYFQPATSDVSMEDENILTSEEDLFLLEAIKHIESGQTCLEEAASGKSVELTNNSEIPPLAMQNDLMETFEPAALPKKREPSRAVVEVEDRRHKKKR